MIPISEMNLFDHPLPMRSSDLTIHFPPSDAVRTRVLQGHLVTHKVFLTERWQSKHRVFFFLHVVISSERPTWRCHPFPSSFETSGPGRGSGARVDFGHE
jgi:hypothetical protein